MECMVTKLGNAHEMDKIQEVLNSGLEYHFQDYFCNLLYRVFIKCYSLKVCDFSEPCKFCYSAAVD